ncbi:dipeptidyl aminopeptidase/acylaminoacyl peptidase [Prevotella dentalis DSM 3688]|uniref:Dipeptidyl aminopeptidase/acylaminoacyl peptidase n=1 Tax=Prevotella dentalis (strain ATCC 49559 / DSM 3688 / JCM 13448 / NCTC 12043 / ES 2772) TaxID=908937 RepID=F9D096_PREDD|nr:S9 family peptidase [Prevotella dentalis]AGB27868.1 dipeptidyl aminopeptidase/acylaminoacyl peptidase [Prevotella dentalis DSM 3688]EGQ17189.1 prolyl oligopeptidase [Prevotella dentalis DSM 3688]
MKNQTIALALGALLMGSPQINAQPMIQKNNITLASDLMTPEALWAMGRIGGQQASPDGKQVVYQVSYYSVKENKSHTMLFVQPVQTGKNIARPIQLTHDDKNESDPSWIEAGHKIAFLREGQLWKMNPDGTGREQLTHSKVDIEGFRFSPDGQHVVLIKSLDCHESIQKNPDDLPNATGRLVTDLNYRHWDHYVESIPHPFVAKVHGNSVSDGLDIMSDEPYECPMAPFGGIEQIAWSSDSKQIAYTCRKKTGVDYAISTDADIFLYDMATRQTRNLCKPDGYVEPKIDPTKSMRNQAVNHQAGDMNVGYDTNPKFSPDGQYVAWQSMARNGYESDRNRLCVYNLKTGEKKYVTEQFDSNVDDYCWGTDSKTLYFVGVWHAVEMVYQTNLDSQVMQLTDGWFDYGSVQLLGNTRQLLVSRHSYLQPDDLYVITPNKKEKKSAVAQITAENKHILDQLAQPKVEQRWMKTTDGKQELVWIILPPHFDANKKYPTLLFCEGGPQSPVSQFWSFRWNMFIMAAHGYIVVAPNRRGLPGFGSTWNEAISQDWTGQCMADYLSAIDDAANNLPYVDKDRLGAVGASFGGFSVYYLAGHHNKRFKCFIAHDGAFNLESMYTDTEEAWFSNWEYDDAYWNHDQTAAAKRTYDNSPHRFVDQWDTPILCIHGEKDYRINANQGFGAFNAARLRGIPAELLIYPDENHWVLKPQNGILWQRTYFNWLDRWLKQ